MTPLIGIDAGTSGIKVALIDLADRIVAQASRGLAVSSPQKGWAEQHPDLW